MCELAGAGCWDKHKTADEMQSKLIFVPLPALGYLKWDVDTGTQRGMQAPRSMLEITQPAGSSSISGIHTGGMYHCTLILPTAGQEPQACLIGYFYVYHRPILSKHRCCACQICKTRQQLVWCMCFSTPQLQVAWVCLPSSLSIFSQVGTCFICMVKWPCQSSTKQAGVELLLPVSA